MLSFPSHTVIPFFSRCGGGNITSTNNKVSEMFSFQSLKSVVLDHRSESRKDFGLSHVFCIRQSCV